MHSGTLIIFLIGIYISAFAPFWVAMKYFECKGDKETCKNLLDQTLETRDYKKIFLTQEEYTNKKKQHALNGEYDTLRTPSHVNLQNRLFSLINVYFS